MSLPSLPPRLALWTLGVALALAAPATAQPTAPSPTPDVISQGTAFFVFTQPGAPTIEVLLVQSSGRSGIFRIAEETTLTEFMALAGGVGPPDDATEQIIRTTTIRVLRMQNGTRQPIYEAGPEALIREPARHPVLQDGDVVSVEVDVERIKPGFSFRDGLELTARLASLVSVLILLFTRLN